MCKGGNITKPLLCNTVWWTYHHATAQFWPTIMSQHNSDLPSCHSTILTYHHVTAQFYQSTTITYLDSVVLSNFILMVTTHWLYTSKQIQKITTLAHIGDTFIYTPRHTRAEGKVAGSISSEYVKQLHNTLNEIHSHHARERERI